VDNQSLHIRVINKDGSLLTVKNGEYVECSSLLYESELSSFELLNTPDNKALEQQHGSLQLKKGLDDAEFKIAEVKPNMIPYCAVIHNAHTIQLADSRGTKSLQDILGTSLLSEDKALLFARKGQLDGKEGYLADIIIF
jgi:hypothetical protein